VLALVRRARRRIFQNELIAQGANASSAALLAFILLLLLGAEILDWRIVVAIPAVALAIGVWLARRRLPTAYRTAQKIDARLGLADTLSTALYYSETGAAGSPEIVRLQAAEAERIAADADLRRALPYTLPRAAYASAALFLVAGSLFALRYGVTRQLDLKAPLASLLGQPFSAGKTKQEQAKSKMPKVPRPDAAPDGDLASADEQQIRSADPNGNSQEQADENEQPGKSESKSTEKGSKKSEDGQSQAESEQQEAGNEDRPGNDGDNASSGQQGNKQDGKQGSQKQDANNSGDNNSLMSKVKDAVQNLLSRMKPQQNQSGGQQQQGEQNSQQGKGQQNGNKQQSAKNGQQQKGDQQSEGQDGQAGEQAESSQDQQGKGQGNSDSKQASKQPGSGVGSQDGDKRIKQAEQLAAMGKISEIIGKRSQTLTGETTVEVQQTSQQLKTQYTNRTAQHTQGGAEINRDEVPVALQGYVESYFEQVRKTAPAATAPPKK
jgi:hypothetical protein